MNLYEIETSFGKEQPYRVVAESFDSAVAAWIGNDPTERAHTTVLIIRLVENHILIHLPEEAHDA